MFNGQQQQQPPPPGGGGNNGGQGQQGGNPPQRNIQAFLQQLITMDAQQRQRYLTQYPQLQMILQQYEQQRRQRMAQFPQGQGQGQPQPQPPQQQVPPPSSQQHQRNTGAGMMQPQQPQQPQQQQQMPIVPPQQQQNMNYMNPNASPAMNMQMQQRLQQQQQQQQQHPPQQHPQQQMVPGVPPNKPTPQPAPKRTKKKKSVAAPEPPRPTQVPVPPGHPMALQQQQLTQAQIQAQIQAAQIQRAQGQPIPMPGPMQNGMIPPGAQVNHLPPHLQQPIPPQKPLVPQISPPEHISDIHYWSNYLEKESKPVATNVLMYEQIIDRDSNYLNALEREKTDSDESTDLMKRLIKEVEFYKTVRDSRFKIIQDKESGGHAQSIWGEGYQGYGNGFSDRQKTQLILPDQAKRATKYHPKYVSPEDTLAQANKPEELVPIRLEFDLERDKLRLTDTFLWNLNESTISVEELVQTIADDFKFRNDAHLTTLLTSIKEQLSEYLPMIYPKPSYNSKIVDLRIPIKLDITIGNNRLTDRFEWDVINVESDPEEFAQVLCEEMSLPGEFITAIAHSIREQTQIFVRALYMIGYKFDGSPVDGDEVRRFIGPSLDPTSVIRPRYLLADWSTSLAEVNFTEYERLDKEREREARRKRRGQQRVGRRGGAVLPDLTDVPKTFRTPIVSSVFFGGVNVNAPADGFLETLLGIEVPKEQIEALEEFKEKERLNAIKKQEEALQRQNNNMMEEGDYYSSSEGTGRVSVISNDYNRFVVKIKYK